MIEIEKFLQCPKCGGDIKNGQCVNCLFKIKQDENGIWRLTENSDFYFREKMPKEALRKIIFADDIFKKCYQVFKGELGWKYDFYALETNRGMGAILGKLKPDSIVLDYGSGWGNVGRFMSNYVAHVFSMDLTYEGLFFCKRISPDNMTFLHGGDDKNLPFKKNTLDIIFLNGVLEWIPEYDLAGEPRKIQIDFLKKIKDILKPGGQVIIGIENRYALKYFLGMPEDHSEISFGSLLPRKVTNFISQIKYKKPFRTYTYGYFGYKKILEEAGYHDIAIDIAHPNYRELTQVFLGDTLLRQEPVSKSKKIRFLVKSGLFKYLAHSYLVHSNASSGSLLGQILASQNEKLSDIRRISNQNHKSTILIITDGFIYKIPTNRTATRNLKREVGIIEELSKRDELKKYLPDVNSLVINSMTIQIIKKEKEMSGVAQIEIDEFFKIKNSRLIAKKYGELFALKNLKTYLEYNNKADIFEKIANYIKDIEVECTFCHGDFHSKNIINTEDGLKIIDWEFYLPLAPLEFDYINLLVYEESYISGRKYFDIIEGLLNNKTFSFSAENRFIVYAEIINQASLVIKLLYFLNHMNYDMGRFENIAFIPYSYDLKYKKIIKLLENFMADNLKIQ